MLDNERNDMIHLLNYGKKHQINQLLQNKIKYRELINQRIAIIKSLMDDIITTKNKNKNKKLSKLRKPKWKSRSIRKSKYFFTSKSLKLTKSNHLWYREKNEN